MKSRSFISSILIAYLSVFLLCQNAFAMAMMCVSGPEAEPGVTEAVKDIRHAVIYIIAIDRSNTRSNSREIIEVDVTHFFLAATGVRVTDSLDRSQLGQDYIRTRGNTLAKVLESMGDLRALQNRLLEHFDRSSDMPRLFEDGALVLEKSGGIREIDNASKQYDSLRLEARRERDAESENQSNDAQNIYTSSEHYLLGAMNFENPVRNFFFERYIDPKMGWFERWRARRFGYSQARIDQMKDILRERINIVRGEEGKRGATQQDAESAYAGVKYESFLPKEGNKNEISPYLDNLSEQARNSELPRVVSTNLEDLRRIGDILRGTGRNSVVINGSDYTGRKSRIYELIYAIEDVKRNPESSPYRDVIPEELRDVTFVTLKNGGLDLIGQADNKWFAQFDRTVKEMTDAIEGHEKPVILVAENLNEFTFIGLNSSLEGNSSGLGAKVRAFLQRASVNPNTGFRMIGVTNPRELGSFRSSGIARFFTTVPIDPPGEARKREVLTHQMQEKLFNSPLFTTQQQLFIIEQVLQTHRRQPGLGEHLDGPRNLLEQVFADVERGLSPEQRNALMSIKAEINQTENRDTALRNIDEMIERHRLNIEVTGVTISSSASVLLRGIPITLRFGEEVYKDVEGFRGFLKQRVIGHDAIIDRITRSIMAGFRGVNNSVRRLGLLGAYVLIGPPGIGKTSLAESIADHFPRMQFIKINGAEMQENAKKLIGEAPILGRETDINKESVATKLDQNPLAVLYVEEANKAGREFFDYLEPITSEGKFTDANGRTIYMNNVILILDLNPHPSFYHLMFGAGESITSEVIDNARTGWNESKPGWTGEGNNEKAKYPEGSPLRFPEELKTEVENNILLELGGRQPLASRLGRSNYYFGYLSKEQIRQMAEHVVRDVLAQDEMYDFKLREESIDSLYAYYQANRNKGARSIEHEIRGLLEYAIVEIISHRGLYNGPEFLGREVSFDFKIIEDRLTIEVEVVLPPSEPGQEGRTIHITDIPLD